MKYCKVRDVKSPERGTSGSAGIDFFVPNQFRAFTIPAGYDALIPSGIKMEIPSGYMLMAANKSGIATTKWACLGAGRTPKEDAFGSSLVVGACVVDGDFQGEIFIHLINVGQAKVVIKPGMKIAQFVLVPVGYHDLEEVEEKDMFIGCVSERGKGALGSTDKRIP